MPITCSAPHVSPIWKDSAPEVEQSAHPIAFFWQTDNAWQSLFAACRNAKRSIHIMQYLLSDDALGHQLARLLTYKARQGVEVIILLDMFGSKRAYRSDAFAALKQAGVTLHYFHPLKRWTWLYPAKLFPRNHAKLFIIDGDIAYLGGVCIARYMSGWHDFQMKLTGEVIKPMQAHFNTHYHYLMHKETNNHGLLDQLQSQESRCRYLIQDPTQRIKMIYKRLLPQIEQSQRYIYLTSPYFFPTKQLRLALQQAIKRGVRVILILSQETDHPFADCVTRALLKEWEDMGLETYFYEPAATHAKYCIIDDRWATVGSCNFDLLSLQMNIEANLEIESQMELESLKFYFLKSLQHSRPAQRQDWEDLSLWHQITAQIGRRTYHWL